MTIVVPLHSAELLEAEPRNHRATDYEVLYVHRRRSARCTVTPVGSCGENSLIGPPRMWRSVVSNLIIDASRLPEEDIRRLFAVSLGDHIS